MIDKQIRVLIVGYIGHRNFGDDLLLDIALKKLQKLPNASVSVVLNNAESDHAYVSKLYPDLEIIKYEHKLPLLLYLNFNKIYYIGGGVFFDYSLKLSVNRFIKKYFSNFVRYRIPRLFGVSFAGVGIGIGPYYCSKTRILGRQVLSNFQILGVRDTASYEFAKKSSAKHIILTNDLSIQLNNQLQQLIDKTQKTGEVIFCPRTFKHKLEFEKHLDSLYNFGLYLKQSGIEVHWVFMQKEDELYLNKIRQEFKITVWNPDEMGIIDFVAFFINANVVYASRMHAVYISGLVGTPFVPILLHPKVEFASRLFYNSPICILPDAGLEEYVRSYEEIGSIEPNVSVINTEAMKLLQLDNLVFDWFSS